MLKPDKTKLALLSDQIIAAKILNDTFDFIQDHLEYFEGSSTLDIDNTINMFVTKRGGYLPCIGYKGYKHGTCISVDEDICHAVPTNTRIINSDSMFTVDIAVGWDNGLVDAARTYTMRHASIDKINLKNDVEKLVSLVIPEVKVGMTNLDVGALIEKHSAHLKVSLIKEFSGHGIGTKIHQPPTIPNFAATKYQVTEYTLNSGDVFTIEPLVTNGLDTNWKVGHDGWTISLIDRTLFAAHHEHTVHLTDSGLTILI